MTVAIGAIVFLLGLGNCLHYGRQGLMPLDQSIIFDAGWRVLSGQVPFRDFLTPVGIVPAYMQAAFFGVFGVTWFAYVLHAAVLNGLFAILVMALLRRFDVGLLPATLCGLATGVCFYTPIGTPFADQHAFFFIGLALWCAVGVERSQRLQLIGLAVAPIVLALAVLSKQNPGFMGVLPVGIACLWPRPGVRYVRQLGMVTIGAGCVGLFALWATTVWSEHEAVWTYFWVLPQEEGVRRGLNTTSLLTGIADSAFLREVHFDRLKFLPAAIAVLAFLTAATSRVFGWSQPREGGVDRVQSPIQPLMLAAACYAVTSVFVTFTNNQKETGLALIPLIVGLTLAAFGWFSRTYGRGHGSPARLVRFGSMAVVAAALFALTADLWGFQVSINRTRAVHDFRFDQRIADEAAGQLPDSMSFLQWHPVGPAYSAADLSTLVRYFDTHAGNLVVFSDSLFLYAITGRPSVNPNLWYHPGLAMATHGPAEAAFARRFETALARYRPRFAIVEAPRTWGWFVPLEYPVIKRWLEEKGCRDIPVVRTVRVLECAER